MAYEPHDLKDAGRAYLGLHRANRVIHRIFTVCAMLLLGIFTCLVLLDVVLRELVQRPAFWPGEWALIAFIWATMTGAAACVHRGSHFVVDVLPTLTPRLERGLRVFNALCVLLFAIVLLVYGYQFAQDGLRRVSAILGLPMIWAYAAFPVCAVGFITFAIEQLWVALCGYPDPWKETC